MLKVPNVRGVSQPETPFQSDSFKARYTLPNVSASRTVLFGAAEKSRLAVAVVRKPQKSRIIRLGDASPFVRETEDSRRYLGRHFAEHKGYARKSRRTSFGRRNTIVGRHGVGDGSAQGRAGRGHLIVIRFTIKSRLPLARAPAVCWRSHARWPSLPADTSVVDTDLLVPGTREK